MTSYILAQRNKLDNNWFRLAKFLLFSRLLVTFALWTIRKVHTLEREKSHVVKSIGNQSLIVALVRLKGMNNLSSPCYYKNIMFAQTQRLSVNCQLFTDDIKSRMYIMFNFCFNMTVTHGIAVNNFRMLTFYCFSKHTAVLKQSSWSVYV